MTGRPGEPIDVRVVRRTHPIRQVIAAAGVELTPRGKGFIGCCPFHADARPSMSVDGVPDRFHCFGCGASGDVIEFVQRRYGLSFREAVDHLHGTDLSATPPSRAVPAQRAERPTIGRTRAYEINSMAWEIFADPIGARFAHSWLLNHRGIDTTALELAGTGPLAGRAGSGWTHLVDALARRGVTEDELLAVDLAQRTSHGHLIDTLRNRVVLPVHTRDGRISGFIGRDTTDDPRTPKYRNPTHTPVFDKALTLYRPTHVQPHPHAKLVVVEGPVDALAMAAASYSAGLSDQMIPVTTSGTAVSPPQAAQACALAPAGIVLALDSDDAGRAGTERWIDALTVQRHRMALVADLPDGRDPADWLAEHGIPGLAALGADLEGGPFSRPRMPGRELVRILILRSRDPIRDTAHELLSLARLTSDRDAERLLQSAEAEMSKQGWNPRGVFGNYLRSQRAQEVRDRLRHPDPSPPLGSSVLSR
jgi:DNA primase